MLEKITDLATGLAALARLRSVTVGEAVISPELGERLERSGRSTHSAVRNDRTWSKASKLSRRLAGFVVGLRGRRRARFSASLCARCIASGTFREPGSSGRWGDSSRRFGELYLNRVSVHTEPFTECKTARPMRVLNSRHTSTPERTGDSRAGFDARRAPDSSGPAS